MSALRERNLGHTPPRIPAPGGQFRPMAAPLTAVVATSPAALAGAWPARTPRAGLGSSAHRAEGVSSVSALSLRQQPQDHGCHER